jgi:ferric-dicitrate binding protein FerR (iron transport regulator)
MVTELKGRVPPEVEERLNKAGQVFRENHRDPANLALHAAAAYAVLKGLRRVARRRWIRGLLFIAAGVALVLAGHEIEGTDAFQTTKSLGNGSRKK